MRLSANTSSDKGVAGQTSGLVPAGLSRDVACRDRFYSDRHLPRLFLNGENEHRPQTQRYLSQIAMNIACFTMVSPPQNGRPTTGDRQGRHRADSEYRVDLSSSALVWWASRPVVNRDDSVHQACPRYPWDGAGRPQIDAIPRKSTRCMTAAWLSSTVRRGCFNARR